MIGESKRIIAVNADENYIAMLNPEILKKSAKRFKVSEGCLSLEGEKETERHDWIEVKFRDLEFKKQRQKFSGFTAQIIQHEIDHCNGILI
jgi:peptide deformylase